jgi:hypothetical protein
MPLNKDQLLRYQILDRCFGDGSKLYKMSDLVEAVNAEMMDTYCKKVSKRSVQNDVLLLQYEPYNVEFDDDLRKQDYYRYADTSFRFAKTKDALHTVLVTTYGLKQNAYSGSIYATVTADNLFEK